MTRHISELLDFRKIMQYVHSPMKHQPIKMLIFWSESSEYSYYVSTLTVVQVWFCCQMNSICKMFPVILHIGIAHENSGPHLVFQERTHDIILACKL